MRALCLLGIALTTSLGGQAQAQSPEDVARSFYAAYERGDMNALRSLFASEAQVIRLRLRADGEAKVDKDDALKWVTKEERALERVTELSVQLGEVRTLIVDSGASVSIVVKTRRREGREDWSTSGISTFSLAHLGGKWRIMQVSTFEREN